MKIHGTFTQYAPDASTCSARISAILSANPTAIFLRNEAGADWYDLVASGIGAVAQVLNGVVVAATADASSLFPDGCVVIEPETLPERGSTWNGAAFAPATNAAPVAASLYKIRRAMMAMGKYDAAREIPAVREALDYLDPWIMPSKEVSEVMNALGWDSALAASLFSRANE
jgi:hypothetical protein